MHRDRFSTKELQVEPIFGGDRFVLPPRKLGHIRHFGWILVGSGLFGVGFMVAWMGLPIAAGVEELRQQQGWSGWFSIGFGLLGVVGLVPSLGLLVAGSAVVCDRTHTVIELRDGWLTVKEKFFFLSWRRKCRLPSIHRIRFGARMSESIESLPSIVGELATGLVAEGDGVTFLITAAYPRTLLAEFGRRTGGSR